MSARRRIPTAGTSSGVYLPYSVDATTGVATFNGGGIYVQGDAATTITTSGNNQIYTIVQNGTTTTVTVNVVTNTTQHFQRDHDHQHRGRTISERSYDRRGCPRCHDALR